MKAVWKGTLLAESNQTIVIEGNHYFPPESVNRKFLEDSDHRSRCPWKGLSHYYHIVVDGEINENAAWYYPEPLEAANEIENYVAFWKGVEITEDK
ncbi:DUF427 domain-containing protein [Gottschalkiaceae bacterium SANA]|nr:DUF427 domain-containing protein [Gottschalkiaceae bacterium SANA]